MWGTVVRASEGVALARRIGVGPLPLLGRARERAWPLGLVALVAGSCLLWLPALDLPLHPDAAGYAIAAYWWARGDTLYRNITITRPQGIFVVFRIIEAVGLGSVRGIHVAAMLCATLSALILLAVAGRLWGRGIGLASAGLFAALIVAPCVEGYSANAELFMLPPLLGSLYCLVRADDHPLESRSGRWLVAACGFLGAVALLIKPSGVAALALPAWWLFQRRFRERLPWSSCVRAEVALGLGCLAGLAPAVAHGLLTVPDLYLQAVLVYRLTKDSAASAGLGDQFYHLAYNSLYIVARLPILLLAPVAFLPRGAAGDARGRRLLGAWLLATVGGMALGGNWFVHYYQQALPPLAVAVALGLRALLCRPRGLWQAALQGVAVTGVISLIAGLAALSATPASLQTPDTDWPSLGPSAPVAAYLRDHTAPGDSIYVVYQQPDIYYLAARRPAARWLYVRELMWEPGAFDAEVARLANPATAPRYIVGAQHFDEFGLDANGALRAVAARDYSLETTIDGIPIYRRLDRPVSGAATGRPE